MSSFCVMLIAAALFIAAVLNLALKTNFRNRVMGVSALIAILTGISSYGYAYRLNEGFTATAVLRTLLTVSRMFGGVNDFASVQELPLFQSKFVLSLFWLGHFLAFYVTASAAVEVLGEQLLRSLRLRMLRYGEIVLVYGATPDTAPLVKRRGRHHATVFISEPDGPDPAPLAEAMNGTAFSEGILGCATASFLKRIGVGGDGRRIVFYGLHPDPSCTLRFARALLLALEAREVPPDCTDAFLLGVSEAVAAPFQAVGDGMGFGALMACPSQVLIARLIAQKLPPWSLMTFDGSGRATGDFRVVIVGFGQMGRAALFHLVMNGQMEGSAFHAEVFDPGMDELRGFVEAFCPELLKAFDIRLVAASAGSSTFCQSVIQNPPSLIVLCTGSAARNAKLAMDLEYLFAARPHCPPILQCTVDSLHLGEEEARLGSIDVNAIDRRTMVVNHYYRGGPSPEADWKDCDPFSRASSRASADFMPAFLKAAGISREEALAGNWPPPPEVLENLARTEHRRWCAFHLAMGYRPMSREEFEARAQRLARGENLRVSRDAKARVHACLVPWEELDALSELESRLTGRQVDYRQIDINNVLALPDILRLDETLSPSKQGGAHENR